MQKSANVWEPYAGQVIPKMNIFILNETVAKKPNNK